MNLPLRRFLYSRSTFPYESFEYQSFSLPLPLPIREPATFFVKGRWGNAFNHNFRPVLSDRLEALLRNSFNLKSRLEVIEKGWSSRTPWFPYLSLLSEALRFIDRFFCEFLYENFLGRNNNYTNIQENDNKVSST